MRTAEERFRELGAMADEISLPEHNLAVDCWTAITLEGLQGHMMHGNAAPFNSGLPAMRVPFGLSEGLTIGMTRVGPSFGEMKIYHAANALEKSGDWREMQGELMSILNESLAGIISDMGDARKVEDRNACAPQDGKSYVRGSKRLALEYAAIPQ